MGKIKQVLYCNKTSRKLLVSYTFVELSRTKKEGNFSPPFIPLMCFSARVGRKLLLGGLWENSRTWISWRDSEIVFIIPRCFFSFLTKVTTSVGVVIFGSFLGIGNIMFVSCRNIPNFCYLILTFQPRLDIVPYISIFFSKLFHATVTELTVCNSIQLLKSKVNNSFL